MKDKGIYKRCDCPDKDKCKHSWIISYFHNGRRKRKAIGTNKGLAQTVLGKFKAQIREGKYLDVPREKQVTFEQFAEIYLAKHGNGKESVETDDKPAIKTASTYFGTKKLLAINAEDGQSYKIEEANRVAKSTVNKRITLLRCIFQRAVEWGYLHKNPFNTVKRFKLGDEDDRERVLSVEELDYLMAASDKELQAIIMLALMTLLRKKDICLLDEKKFNFTTRYINTVQTKTKKKIAVPMNDTVYSILKNKDIKLPIEYNFRKRFETAHKNAILNKQKEMEQKGEHFDKSFLDDFMFRDLRRTGSSYLHYLGVDLYTIAILLGHKTPKHLESLSMTTKYAKVSTDHLYSAMKKLDAYCGLASGRDWTHDTKLSHEPFSEENKNLQTITP